MYVCIVCDRLIIGKRMWQKGGGGDDDKVYTVVLAPCTRAFIYELYLRKLRLLIAAAIENGFFALLLCSIRS